MVRRTASTHSAHAAHFADRPTYGMSTERATEIQSALIQRGYLSGEPTGSWDTASISAMQKLQSDNGWQTKFVPDSRAIIKLGLGPNTTPAPTATASATAQTAQLPAAN
jgi:peptidoglycan hydrolase-like protein with peptidoglycan-binding domain